jgi:hypothetical protein
MGASFYWGTEADLYSGARSFSAKLSADPAAYGISVEQASDYAAVVAVWKAAYEEAHNPSQRTKSHTFAKNDAKREIRAATARLAKCIAGTPTVTDQQKCDLGLSIRSTARTAGVPGTPNNFRVELSAIGAITIFWKCANPTAGTMYEVYRTIEGMGGGAGSDAAETYLATVGKKRFTDATVPAGSSRVTYRVRAVRSTAKGEWTSFNVNFGVTAIMPSMRVANDATTSRAA